MSEYEDEGTPSPEGRSADNVKAEFDRKFGNLKEQNEAMSSKLDALMNTIASQKQAPAKTEPLEDIDPDIEPGRYLKSEIPKIKEEIISSVTEASVAQQAKQQVLVDLANKYPDLNNPDSELYKAALQSQASLPPELKTTAEGYKLAILDAVSNTGASKVSKKGNSEDIEEFIGGASNSGEPRENARKKSSELDPRIEATAKLMGLDTSKKEVREQLQKRAERKNWSRWSKDQLNKKGNK